MVVTAARAVRPTSARALADTLRDADAEGLAVVPRGNGSQQHVGNPPSRADLVLETTALSGILEHNPADLTVTVAAGTSLRELQAALARAGQRLALDPPGAEAATVGGIIATNASGPRRQRHGTLRDLLIGTRAALVDGTIARAGGKVVKNVAGYDLDKLYIGSLGTLAIVVEATFKVLPLPAREEALVARFDDLRDAVACGAALARTALRPAALEAHDLDGDATLVVVAEGEAAPVARVLDEAARIAREHGARATERRADVEGLLAVSRAIAGGDGAVLRASLPLAATSAYVAALRQSGAERTVRGGVAAHAGAGIVRARFAGDAEAVREAVLAAAALAKSLDGDAWIERASDPLRDALPDVWLGEPAAFFLMRRIKHEFDPKGTLNPGRFVGGL